MIRTQTMRKVSIGIVVYKTRKEVLKETLSALIRACDLAESSGLSCEIKVVDNGHNSRARSATEDIVSGIERTGESRFRIEQPVKNLGYGTAQNVAHAGPQYDYYLVLNPDVVMADSCIADCVRYLDAHTETAMVVPQGFDAQGNYARLAKRYPSVAALLLRWLGVPASGSAFGKLLREYAYFDELPSDLPMPVELASGCFMFCRGREWKTVRGFDERFFLYFEDFDLSLRVRKLGNIVELPEARIVHAGGSTAHLDVRRFALFVVSGIKFFGKHGWKIF